jgi:hypothetical protein
METFPPLPELGSKPGHGGPAVSLLITSRDEKHQVELLQRFQAEGVPCKALLS